MRARRTTTEPFAPRAGHGLPRGRDEALSDQLEWCQVSVVGDFSEQAADDVEVMESRLTGARFAGAELRNIRMTDTVVENCDLSGVVLGGASLVRVEFRNCRMSGCVLAGCELRDVRFTECRVDDANFRMVTGVRVQFDHDDLRTAEFNGASLPSSRFFDCDLTGAEFSKADLTAARLHGSTINGLKGARYLTAIVIDSAQILPLALAMYASLGIAVDDEREPPR